MAIVVLIALILWGVAVFVANEAIKRHVRGYVSSARRGESFANDLYQAVLMLLLAVALFVVGLTMMTAVLGDGQVAAIVFGVAYLAGAFVSWRHYQSSRKFRFWHFVTILSFLIAGVLILTIGL